MSGRILLCIDTSYQVYRSAAAHSMLTSGQVYTGGLYGFFTTLAKMIRETEATDIIFCQDVKPYLRSKSYPKYKQIRKKNLDEDLLRAFKQSMSLVLDALDAGGLPVWGVQGFESDDLIGHCVMRYRHRFDAIYAGSNDSDLYQLFWAKNFHVYRSSIKDVMNGWKLQRDTHLTPEEFMLSTAITGTHNDVQGIVGVGDVTARKAIRDPAKMRALREKHGALIDRNLELIRLPHPAFPSNLPLPRVQSFRPRELYRVLGRYDIDVTGAIVKSLEQVTERRR